MRPGPVFRGESCRGYGGLLIADRSKVCCTSEVDLRELIGAVTRGDGSTPSHAE